jgi:hypothetical protein
VAENGWGRGWSSVAWFQGFLMGDNFSFSHPCCRLRRVEVVFYFLHKVTSFLSTRIPFGSWSMRRLMSTFGGYVVVLHLSHVLAQSGPSLDSTCGDRDLWMVLSVWAKRPVKSGTRLTPDRSPNRPETRAHEHPSKPWSEWTLGCFLPTRLLLPSHIHLCRMRGLLSWWMISWVPLSKNTLRRRGILEVLVHVNWLRLVAASFRGPWLGAALEDLRRGQHHARLLDGCCGLWSSWGDHIAWGCRNLYLSVLDDLAWLRGLVCLLMRLWLMCLVCLVFLLRSGRTTTPWPCDNFDLLVGCLLLDDVVELLLFWFIDRLLKHGSTSRLVGEGLNTGRVIRVLLIDVCLG